MKTIAITSPVPPGAIETWALPGGLTMLVIETQADYTDPLLPADIAARIATRTAAAPADAAAQLAAQAKEVADSAAARAYAKLNNLKAMTPAQVQAWVTANVTTLAQAQDAIATLAIAVSILARRI